MTMKNEIVARYEKMIEELQGQIKKLVDIPIDELSEAFPNGQWEIYSHSIDFVLPYDFESIQRMEKFLKENNWYSWNSRWVNGNDLKNPTAFCYFYCHNNKTLFDVGFKSNKEGGFEH